LIFLLNKVLTKKITTTYSNSTTGLLLMSTNTKKAIAARYFYEVFNEANMTTLEEICAPDFLFTLPTHSEPFRGVEGYKDLVNMIVGCFPDIHFAVEDMVEEGDRVLTRWTARGTHTGQPFPTVIGDIPAIGNSFLIEGMSWHRIVNGKIVEVIANEDSLGLIQQLGRVLFPTQTVLTEPKPISPQVNKGIIDRYFNEVMNQGKLDVIDEIMAPNFAFRIPTIPDPVRGRDGMKQFVSGLRNGFPDIQFTVQHQVAEGNKVATHYSMIGTHKGDFLGVPPTNNQVEDSGNDLFHLANEQITEIWVSEDAVGLMVQLGVLAAEPELSAV
jgi:steroid delta-isomerase-like uncharacterized protein